MNPHQSDSSSEPRTPTKFRPSLFADDLRFIISQQKPRHYDLVQEYLEDRLENNLLFLTKTKQVHSDSEPDYDSYNSAESSSNEPEKPHLQQEKCQTVKKIFEPKSTQPDARLMTTARTAKKGCNCDKSKCQKNYCICYKNGGTCSSDCECIDCQNHVITSQHLKNEKIALELMSNTKNKGCNCKKSNCLKSYCICHQNGRKCSVACRCEECHNGEKDGRDEFDENDKGVRLMFGTARKRVKVSQFGCGDGDKENLEMEV